MTTIRFTTDTGASLLSRLFGSVDLRRHEMPLSFPSTEPVVAYLDSVRESVLAHIGEPLDCDTVLREVAARVADEVRVRGRFRMMARMGVFVCRR
jgi:hypothetical protein